jgi:hypothetical protein
VRTRNLPGGIQLITESQGDILEAIQAVREALFGVGHQPTHLTIELVDIPFWNGTDMTLRVREGNPEPPAISYNFRQLTNHSQADEIIPVDQFSGTSCHTEPP